MEDSNVNNLAAAAKIITGSAVSIGCEIVKREIYMYLDNRIIMGKKIAAVKKELDKSKGYSLQEQISFIMENSFVLSLMKL